MNKISPVNLDQYGAMDMAEKRRVWREISDITEAQFEAHMATQKAREANVPEVGSLAPDFTAALLGRNRKGPNEHGSSELVTLSALRGKPVGLVFGSYT